MSERLEAGDTVYVPVRIDEYIKLFYWKDITTVVANTIEGLGVMALLATKL